MLHGATPDGRPFGTAASAGAGVIGRDAVVLALKNLLFTVLVPGTVAVYLPLAIAGGRDAASGALLVLALVLFTAGGALYAWCVWDFATSGRGTPAPIDAPTRLVAEGPYRYVRNPMYVGVLAVISAWAVLLRSSVLLLYLGFVTTVFTLFVVLYEEPHLRRLFGEPYDAYCARVGRWFPRRCSRT